MPNINKETLIDGLLIYMNDTLEDKGMTPNLCDFSFDDDEEDNMALGSQYDLTSDEVKRVVKICRARNYIKSACINCGLYSRLKLTTGGQRRAIAAKQERNRPRETRAYNGAPEPTPQHIVDQHIHVSTKGPVIVGDNNTQRLVTGGDNNTQTSSNSTVTQPPNENDGLFKHPMTTTIVVVIGGIIAAVIGAYLTMQGGQ